MVMGFFRGEKNLLKRLQRSDWNSEDEKNKLLQKLAGSRDYKLAELAFMFQHRDSEVSEFALRRIVPSAPAEEAVPTLLDVHSKMHQGETQRMVVNTLCGLSKDVLVRHLGRQLGSADSERRAAAFEILRKLPVEPQVAKLWAQAIRTLSGAARQQALRTVLSDEMYDPEVFGDLVAGLARDPDPVARVMFLERLRDKGVEGFQQDILVCLEDPTPKVRREALELVKAYANTFEFEDLLPLATRPDAVVREEGLRCLLCSEASPARPLTRVLDALAEEDPQVRTRALQSIEELQLDIFDHLQRLLKTSHGVVQQMVAELMVGHDRPEAAAAAEILLDIDDWWLQMVALETLGKYGRSRVVSKLRAKLKDPQVSWAAIEALAKLDNPEARQCLIDYIEGADRQTYKMLVRALGRQSGRQGRKMLLNIAKNAADKKVRHDASRVMKKTFELETILTNYIDQPVSGPVQGHADLLQLFRLARERGATDLHLSVGEPPMLRVQNEMLKLKVDPLTAEELHKLVFSLLGSKARAELEAERHVDVCYSLGSGRRVRGNIYQEHNGMSATFRIIWQDVPTFGALGLPQVLTEIADYHQGMALFAGPSRCGKTTTLAAVLNYINELKRHHIIALEDPIEIFHENKNSIVHQRQLIRDTRSFAQALRSALREDPDIIIIGEMRDRDTIEIACTAAETGHLVLSTLHTPSAPKAIDRVISSFSPREQGQIRSQLADSLKFVVAQNLLKRADGSGMVAFFEVIKMSAAISNLVREQKTHLVGNQMTLERNNGCIPRDNALLALVEQNLVDPFEAYRFADDRSLFAKLVPRAQLESYCEE